jgi:hypothetical protein
VPSGRETRLFKNGYAIKILMENEKYSKGNIETERPQKKEGFEVTATKT